MNEQISKSVRSLEEFERDSKWFYENIDAIREKNLTGQFVAIKNKTIIATNDNIDIVVDTLEKKGENPAYIVIEFVYPKEAVILL